MPQINPYRSRHIGCEIGIDRAGRLVAFLLRCHVSIVTVVRKQAGSGLYLRVGFVAGRGGYRMDRQSRVLEIGDAVGLFGGRKARQRPARAQSAAPVGELGLAEHQVCSLRAGMRKAEVAKRIGRPTVFTGSKEARERYRKMGETWDGPKEYWLYKSGEGAPEGFIFEVLIHRKRLASVRVKPLGPNGRELATVIRINEDGVQAVSPYRELLGAQPANWNSGPTA